MKSKFENREEVLLLESIRQTRIETGYAQEYIADCLGMNQATYHKIESGKLKLKAVQLFALVKILKIDLLQIQWKIETMTINQEEPVQIKFFSSMVIPKGRMIGYEDKDEQK